MIDYTYPKSRSLQASIISSSMRLIGTKNMVARDLKKAHHNKAEMPKRLMRKFDVESLEVAGHRVWVIKPQQSKSTETVLYFHGGAYIYGIHRQYWGMIEALVSKTDATYIIPDYPLAPEHTAVEVYAFILAVYEAVAQKQDIAAMTFLGDSAGGGLALGFTQMLRNENKTLPKQVILLSPWLDVNLDNPAIPALEKKDPELSAAGLRLAGKAYAGAWGTDDYRVSVPYWVSWISCHPFPCLSVLMRFYTQMRKS